ncbi:MAG: RNA polymerase sigma factor [Planctomycetota bacterium]|nr:RNA polymerase sigma factor [Planctomycetota bacterium]
MELDVPLKSVTSSCLNQDTDRELIERAKSDPNAFAQLYRLHYHRLALYIHRRTGQQEVTEDLVGELFLIVLRKLPRYQSHKAPFRFWLYRVATNLVNQWARGERRRLRRLERHAAGLAATSDPKEVTSDQDQLRLALLALSPNQQSLLMLHYRESFSIEQIAIIIRRPQGTVKSRLHRARNSLREAMEARCEDV